MQATKITYLINSLMTGGAELQLLNLLRSLDRRHFDPSLIVFDDNSTCAAARIVERTYSLNIRSNGYSRSPRILEFSTAVTRLSARLRELRPDVLHAVLPASCILAAATAKFVRPRILIGSRRSLVDCYRRKGVIAALDRLAIRACDVVIANSAAIQEELVNLESIPRARIAMIYNGVDAQRFSPGDRSVRARYGWTEENVVLGMVANFYPYKGHADFIRAAAVIVSKAPQARFVLVGEDRGVLPHIEQQIDNLGLRSRFVVIPGSSQLQKIYPAMDVYVCTSATEGFSNVLLEAAASALPIIATSVGGNTEIVRKGENGLLVPIGGIEDIAAAALQLIGDVPLRRSLGARGRRLVETRFSMEAMVQDHEALYERIVNVYPKDRPRLWQRRPRQENLKVS